MRSQSGIRSTGNIVPASSVVNGDSRFDSWLASRKASPIAPTNMLKPHIDITSKASTTPSVIGSMSTLRPKIAVHIANRDGGGDAWTRRPRYSWNPASQAIADLVTRRGSRGSRPSSARRGSARVVLHAEQQGGHDSTDDRVAAQRRGVAVDEHDQQRAEQGRPGPDQSVEEDARSCGVRCIAVACATDPIMRTKVVAPICSTAGAGPAARRAASRRGAHSRSIVARRRTTSSRRRSPSTPATRKSALVSAVAPSFRRDVGKGGSRQHAGPEASTR